MTGPIFSAPRTFTNRDGKKIVAEILRVEKQAVVLRKKGSRDIRAAIALFSDADQTFIREWAENNIVYKFEVREAKEKTGKTGRKRSAGYQFVENWRYNLDITNRDFSETAPLTARYIIISEATSTVRGRLRTRENKRSDSIRKSRGEFTLPKLGATRTLRHETEPVPLDQSKRVVDTITDYGKNNKPITSSSTFKTDAGLAGIWIKFYNDKGKVVFEYKSRYPRWEKVTWDHPGKKAVEKSGEKAAEKTVEEAVGK